MGQRVTACTGKVSNQCMQQLLMYPQQYLHLQYTQECINSLMETEAYMQWPLNDIPGYIYACFPVMNNFKEKGWICQRG